MADIVLPHREVVQDAPEQHGRMDMKLTFLPREGSVKKPAPLPRRGYAVCALKRFQRAHAVSLALDAVFMPSDGGQTGMVASLALAHVGIPVYGFALSRKNDVKAPKPLAPAWEGAALIGADSVPGEARLNKSGSIGPELPFAPNGGSQAGLVAGLAFAYTGIPVYNDIVNRKNNIPPARALCREKSEKRRKSGPAL